MVYGSIFRTCSSNTNRTKSPCSRQFPLSALSPRAACSSIAAVSARNHRRHRTAALEDVTAVTALVLRPSARAAQRSDGSGTAAARAAKFRCRPLQCLPPAGPHLLLLEPAPISSTPAAARGTNHQQGAQPHLGRESSTSSSSSCLLRPPDIECSSTGLPKFEYCCQVTSMASMLSRSQVDQFALGHGCMLQDAVFDALECARRQLCNARAGGRGFRDSAPRQRPGSFPPCRRPAQLVCISHWHVPPGRQYRQRNFPGRDCIGRGKDSSQSRVGCPQQRRCASLSSSGLGSGPATSKTSVACCTECARCWRLPFSFILRIFY